MRIENLQLHREFIPAIARWHFESWGPLTGARTLDGYTRLLEVAAKSSGIPSVLVALLDDVLVGSVSLVASDMSIRPALTPWLAQLFVAPEHRRKGIGMALVRAASERIRSLGFRWLSLYTSGGLPQYYEKLGWAIEERVEYLGDERTVMRRDLLQAVK
jgi:predicted N-acetyltransferase YhbS